VLAELRDKFLAWKEQLLPKRNVCGQTPGCRVGPLQFRLAVIVRRGIIVSAVVRLAIIYDSCYASIAAIARPDQVRRKSGVGDGRQS